MFGDQVGVDVGSDEIITLGRSEILLCFLLQLSVAEFIKPTVLQDFASFSEIFASVFSVSFIDCTISSNEVSSSSPSWIFRRLFHSKRWSASVSAESLRDS